MLARLRSSGLLRPLIASVALLALYGAYDGWLHAVGRRVLPESELAGGGELVGIAVTLAVEPEQFHMAKLQALGRVIEVRERTAFIVDVAPDDARRFARNYWVERIARWQQP
jgi:hypothetical protein